MIMRKFAFIVALIGLCVLLGFLLREPRRVSSLDGLLVGSAVAIEGYVSEERNFGSGKLLIVGEIPVFCECSRSYLDSLVKISGVVERFPDDLRVRAFSVNIVS